MAARPTPPLAAWISTLSPGLSFAQSNDSRTVSAAAGIVAAFHRADPVRDRCQELGRHVEPAGERTLHGAVDPLAHLDSGDTLAQLRDDAGEVTADRSRITRVETQHVEHIAEVETCGLHPDLHVTLVGRRDLLLGDAEVVDRAAFGGCQDVVAAARHREVPAARPWQQPRCEQLSLPHSDFRLFDRVGDQICQCLHGFR